MMMIVIIIIIMIIINYEYGKKKVPWWKIRIEEDIKQLKKDSNILERVKKGQIGARKEGKAKLIEGTE